MGIWGFGDFEISAPGDGRVGRICGTAANYRAALRGRSRAEFIAKLGIANEESDESVYWLTTLRDTDLLNTPEMHRLLQEATELRAIIAASRSTAIKNENERRRQTGTTEGTNAPKSIDLQIKSPNLQISKSPNLQISKSQYPSSGCTRNLTS